MNRSTLVFFFAIVVVVVVIARCNSRSRLAEEREQSTTSTSPLLPSAPPSPAIAPAVSATPIAQASATPFDAVKVSAGVQPAVVSISVFEPSGKLLRTGTGMFVSDNGRILTTRSLMEGGTHAIAKSAKRILNVTGVLVDVPSDDLAILECEVKDPVSFVSPNPEALAEVGAKVAIVQSPLGRGKTPAVESNVSKKRNEAGKYWLELSTSVANDELGAPVVDGRGEVVGLVTRGPGDPAVVVRPSATLNAVMARMPSEPNKAKFLAEETPPSPAEGPLRKVPLAQGPPGQRSKLIYSPAPAYPTSARSSSGGVKGTGRFRLTFDATGQVKNIVILRSTQNGALDQAAVEALRRWKAAPGEEWTLNVPITFQ